MNSLGVTQLVTLFANFISSKYDEKTTAVLAAVFTQLGDTLTTIAAVEDLKDKEAVTR